MTDTFKLDTRVIAHRGASAYAPENTMAAFTRAVQLGAKWIEFDVQLTSDRIPVVCHDAELARTTKHGGFAFEYPFSYLQTLDAGAWFGPRFSGERIPALAQVLEFLTHTSMYANLELKPGLDDEVLLAKAVLQEIENWFVPPYQRILFSSFSIPALYTLREQSPHCQLALLMDTWVDNWQAICAELQCVSVNVNQAVMTPERAQVIKRTGRALLCYTVNDANRAQQLFSWGIDAVFSDMPDKIMNI